MKKLLLVLNLIFVILLVVFSIQNAQAVDVTFWAWKANISLALLMILCVVAGIVITAVFNRFEKLRNKPPRKEDEM